MNNIILNSNTGDGKRAGCAHRVGAVTLRSSKTVAGRSLIDVMCDGLCAV
jgi:hypothetical protein